ncbi:MAG: cob(I)yrinic acid a,c-diamide adenosyltransferase [Candidatus Methylomirabilales bacterium]
MKIYTKTGDGGETGLFDGTRVAKDHPRVEAYGDIDELNAVIGTALAFLEDGQLREILVGIQKDLFALGAELADPRAEEKPHKEKARLTDERVRDLEAIIDTCESELVSLRHFILPGGSQAGAILHLARTVCRRAERRIVALGEAGVRIKPVLLAYVNRLSDLFFVLARVANHRQGVEEVRW